MWKLLRTLFEQNNSRRLLLDLINITEPNEKITSIDHRQYTNSG